MVKDVNNEDNKDDKDDGEEDAMDVLPPLVARRVERLKCLNTQRERVMEQYQEDSGAGDETFRYMQASIRGYRKRCRQMFV